jgi:hypothetical protein
LATIVHRRVVPASGPAPARGPGARFDSLTWIGYASAVAAFGWLVFTLRPLLDAGDMRLWDWGQVARLVFTALRNAAVVGLPFALELGVPGARTRTPWLMRGSVLLAIEQLSHPLVSAAQDYLSSVLEPTSTPYDTPLGLALGLARLALNLLAIGGAWALADGLFDAGSRPRRNLVAAVVVAGMALSAVAYLPLYGFWPGAGATFDLGTPLFWMNLAGIVMGFIEIAIWFAVGVRLVAGVPFRLHPRLGWVLGAIAGASSLAIRFGGPLLVLGRIQDEGVATAAFIIGTGMWMVLFLAFAAGLGRGRERRDGRPRRLRLFVLNPTD